MDVRTSEEQRLLQQSARELLAAECPMRLVREVVERAGAPGDELWKRIAELGWLGLAVPETHGGAGLGWLDMALLLEEMGRVLVPVPFLSTVLAGALVARHASAESQARWLPPLAAGDQRVALALLEDGLDWRGEALALPARRDGVGWRLTGRKGFVADAPRATAFLVPARCQAGLALFWVPAEARGLRLRAHPYTDETRAMAELHLDDVRLGPEHLLVSVGAGDAAYASLLDHARAALSAELVGLCERVLELSVAYAKTREQFGRPIGSFQAIQHRCADMLVKVESSRSAAWYAAWAVDSQADDARAAACLAKAWCSEAAASVAGSGIQIHGGLGFTWEQDLHFYYKRAVASEQAFGSPAECREQAAELLLDAPRS